MGDGTGLGIGLGSGDFRRPLEDFLVGSRREPPGLDTGGTGGTAGIRNSGFTVWQVREIFLEAFEPGPPPLNRDRVLCFAVEPLETADEATAMTSGGFSFI